MHIIPITPATLDIIEVLNSGLRPLIEDEETFYVFNGMDEDAKIITKDELLQMPEEHMAIVRILYVKK